MGSEMCIRDRGAGCLNHGDSCIIIGTWGVVEAVSSEPLIDPEKKCITRKYGAPGKWIIFFVGYTRASASNLEWFVKEFCRDLEMLANERGVNPYQLCDEEAESIPPGSEGVRYLPFLEGMSEAPQACAIFYGMRRWHSRAHLLRSLFEGVAFSTKLALEELSRVIESKVLKLAGGGARSSVWSQIITDVLGADTEIPEGTELGAKGAAICAAIASGVYKSHEEALRNMTKVSRRCKVDENAKRLYEDLYQDFLDLLKLLKNRWR